MANPELRGKVTLDDSAFEAGMRRVEQLGKNAAGQLGGHFKGLAGPLLALAPAVAAAFSGSAVAHGVAQIFDAGRALQQMSRATGASVQGLVILQSKFRQAGLEGDAVENTIFRLQKSLNGVEDDENKGGAGRIEKLGLNLAALKRMAPDQQFLAVGRAIASIANPAERSAAAMQIFGRAGGQLGALFGMAGSSQVAPGLEAKAQMMARNAAIFEQVSIKLEKVGGILKTFYVGVADRVATTLLPILEKLESINLVAIGQKFGDGLVAAAQAFLGVFANPRAALDAFTMRLMVGAAEFGNHVANDFENLGNELGIIMNRIFSAESFEGVKSGLLGAGQAFVSSLIKGVNYFTIAIRAAAEFLVEKADEAFSRLNGTNYQGRDFGEIMQSMFAKDTRDPGAIRQVSDQLDSDSANNMKAAGNSFTDAFKGMVDEMQRALVPVRDVFGKATFQAGAQEAESKVRSAGAAFIGTSSALPTPGGRGTASTAKGTSAADWQAYRVRNAYDSTVVGMGTALNYDHTQRNGLTGAGNASFQGGLGGSYGQTGNIWSQISGYGPGGPKGKTGVEKSNELLEKIHGSVEDNYNLNAKVWGGAGASGGGGKGGATATR